MFIDASALCAILLREPEAASFADKIEQASSPATSPIAVFESVRALMRVKGFDAADAAVEVEQLLAEAEVAVVTIGRAEQEAALHALDRFGKGRHPARLNMGDCFAYACAKTHGVPLLFKGADFALTDVVPA